MRNSYKLLSLVFAMFFATVQVGYSVNTPVVKSDLETVTGLDLNADNAVDALLTMSAKEIAAVTGKKLTLGERISLFVAKKQVKSMKKKGMDDTTIMNALKKKSSFDWVGFLLGFFLGLIGVLIVYLAMEESQRRSAWIGFGVGAIAYILFIVLIVGSAFI